MGWWQAGGRSGKAVMVAGALAGMVLAATAARAQDCPAIGGAVLHAAPDGKPAARLAVVLHGMGRSAAGIEAVGRTIQQTAGYEHTDVLAPELPFSTFSVESPSDILVCLLQLIDRQWQDRRAAGTPYRQLLLVGHSMGSLFARKLYVVARGELPAAPFESDLGEAARRIGLAPGLEQPREWAGAVERIVLLAGINRGWSVDHHMPLDRMALMHGGLVLNRVVQAVGGPSFTVMATRKGAPFVTQLRLQWLAMMDCASRPAGAAGRGCRAGSAMPPVPVVQLLGTQDDLVPPGDNIDVAAGRRFSYLQVPRTGHRDVIDMAGDDPAARERARVFRRALDPQDPGDATPEVLASRAEPDPDVKHLAFVMHGIRDEGFWTERLGAAARARLKALPDCASDERCKVKLEVSSYGYFPMLSFLKPGARNEKVEWLMDRYTEAKAQYPNATFYYIGHSHGTYLLKEALENYESVRFERVVLAGSVLRSDHDWQALLRAGRVGQVLNLSASADWVVAFFPNAMQMLQLQDLGGAGFYGFDGQGAGFTQVARESWVVGGHGAAVAEDWWGPVADFVATGTLPALPDGLVRPTQAGWVRVGGAVAPLVWLVIGVLLVLGAWLIVRSRLREWAKTAAVLAYGWFIWFVLTTV